MMNMKEMLGEAGRTMSNLDMLKNKNMRDILGESGKTISNTDKRIGEIMARMPDGGPRFEDRSPENQMFSIDAQIENLMKSYNMLVNANEFGRAQEVADQIDQLQQQKIGIQAQNVPFMLQSGPLTDLSSKIGPMMGTLGAMGESARTISNQDREAISSLLDSISE
jgi:Cft2 family RNA processing exonuclease